VVDIANVGLDCLRVEVRCAMFVSWASHSGAGDANDEGRDGKGLEQHGTASYGVETHFI
jgi:hypothetical protein